MLRRLFSLVVGLVTRRRAERAERRYGIWAVRNKPRKPSSEMPLAPESDRGRDCVSKC